MSAVCAHFAPDPARLPHVVVLTVLTTYEDLLGLAEERRHEDDPGRR